MAIVGRKAIGDPDCNSRTKWKSSQDRDGWVIECSDEKIRTVDDAIAKA
jgi:hypothetical protein